MWREHWISGSARFCDWKGHSGVTGAFKNSVTGPKLRCGDQSPVASLTLVLFGAAIDGGHPIFPPNVTTFFSHRPQESDDLFSYSLVTTPILFALPSNVVCLVFFLYKLFHSGITPWMVSPPGWCHPLDGVTPWMVSPPRWCHLLDVTGGGIALWHRTAPMRVKLEPTCEKIADNHARANFFLRVIKTCLGII